jgi:hypothetical protein
MSETSAFTSEQVMPVCLPLMKALLADFCETFEDPEAFGGAVPVDA